MGRLPMTDIKLSICIATFNRAAFIGATLDSIISQATEEVEIVVVDGASSDNTSQVMDEYKRRFPRLRYFRQETNGGIDVDYSKTVEFARGEYCWFLSDDDILKPGAVWSVLDEARRNYWLIVVNAEHRTFDLSKIVDDRRLKLNANRIYRPSDNYRFFAEMAGPLGLISCVVIRRDLWNARSKEPYFGTYFVHIGVIFQSPPPGDALVIAEPLLAIRQGNLSWSTKIFEIWMFKCPRLIWSFPGYPDSAKLKVIPKEPWRKLTTLLAYRGMGHYSMVEYRRFIEPCPASVAYRFAARAIAILPRSILALLVIVCLVSFRRKSKTTLYDLLNSSWFSHCFRWFLPGRAPLL